MQHNIMHEHTFVDAAITNTLLQLISLDMLILFVSTNTGRARINIQSEFRLG